MTFASFMPSLLKYNLSLCFLVATFMTFFSVIGAITVLCGTINTLLRLCVVPSVSITTFGARGVSRDRYVKAAHSTQCERMHCLWESNPAGPPTGRHYGVVECRSICIQRAP